MKVNSISAQNFNVQNTKQNKPAFGTTIKVNEKLMHTITDISAPQMSAILDLSNSVKKDGHNAVLTIYPYDNNIVGQLTRGAKQIAAKIPTDANLNPENYFKAADVVKGIYNNAMNILGKK